MNVVRDRIKNLLDNDANRRVKVSVLHALPFWIGALITGIVAVLYAKLFVQAEHAGLYLFHNTGYLFLLVCPLMFVAAWLLVKRFAPFARGSGIPQVSAALNLPLPKDAPKVNKLLGTKLAVVKVASSLLMAAGGGAIGREGPTIQISASIFKAINERLPAWYPRIPKHHMIITGAAAGLASAFNTPLGGIVFAIEELTKTHFSYFKSALLTGVILAGLTALSLLGPYLYLGYPQLAGVRSTIILGVLPVALIAGLAAAGLGNAILWMMQQKKKLQKRVPEWLLVAALGLGLALLAVFVNSHVLGSGKELMVQGLFTADKSIGWEDPLLRLAGPFLSFSSGAAGGIFAPTLSSGAGIGNFAASLAGLQGAETNLLILAGMAAFLTGITRSPFTSSILVLEMTNSHNVIFYIMAASLVASIVAKLLAPTPFYEHLKEGYLEEVNKAD